MAYLSLTENIALQKVIKHLKRVCKDQLVSIIIYGSKARGDFTPDSDIDLLVLVHNRQALNRDKIYDFLMDDAIGYDLNFSLNIYDFKEFEHLAAIKAPFAANIKREGEVLWTN